MRRFIMRGILLLAVLAVAYGGTSYANLVFLDDVMDSELTVATSAPSSTRSQSSKAKIAQNYGKLPLHFEATRSRCGHSEF